MAASAGDRVGTQPERRRRPRNRKALILAASARQFYREGYHRVSTADIADAVDITPGALYRHFRTKQELLVHVIEHTLTVLDAALPNQNGRDDPKTILYGLATLTVEHRELGVLWQRESRHLPHEQRQALREHVLTLAKRIGELLHTDRPDLTATDVDFLTWATIGVLLSPSYHAIELDADRLPELLATISMAIWRTEPTSTALPDDGPIVKRGVEPGSRRELLLAAAVRLFNERGYQAVSMDDIGASVGITSASVYNHFHAKSDLLTMALSRGAAGLHLGLTHALATASSQREALDLLLRSHVEYMLAHPDLIAILLTEVMHLPEEQQRQIRTLQHDYLAEWLRLLTSENPALTEEDARVITQALFTTVSNIARTKHLRSRSDLTTDLVTVGTAMLQSV